MAGIVPGFVGLRRLLPDPPEQDMVEMFGRRHGRFPQPERMGS